MAEATLIVDALKKALKQQGIRYRDLASHLDVSEATVKRMFSEENFSLERLAQVCQILGMGFSDLAAIMEAEEKRTDRLSEEQEQELASDIKLLLMAFLVINGWQFEQIQAAYQYTAPETIQYLIKLDRLGIIELLPNNRIKLIISPKFSWRKTGPMQRFFTHHMQQDFLESDFLSEDAKHYFLTAMLSPETAHEFARRIEDVVTEFKVRNLEDMHEPLEKREVYSMLLAIRPFRPHAFDLLRR